MKKVILPPFVILLLGLLFVFFLEACKKNKDDSPVPEGMANIQVVLPVGASVDLSKTSIYSLSKSFPVGADGKSTIAFNAGSYEVVYLYNEANKIMMAGIISDENKEISIITTAQALLYHGLGIMYSRSNEERIAYIKKIPTYPQFSGFKAQLEQFFLANPVMFSTAAYTEAYAKAVNDIHNKPVLDLFARQIKVQNADETKSGMTVRAQSGSEENMEIVNTYARRGHAYIYKVAFWENNQFPVTLLSQILNITPADFNLAVRGKEGTAAEVSGPQALALLQNEKESTWKVRIVGVGGKESDITMSDAEKAKYEEMCVEFFAVDLLMPLILDQLDQSNAMYDVLPNDIERVRAYINEVKALVRPSTIDLVKSSDYNSAVKEFFDYALWESTKRQLVYNALINGIKEVVPSAQLQALTEIEQSSEQQQEFLEKLRGGLFTELIGGSQDNPSPVDERFIHISNSNTLDEWTVISKNNNVTITPKHSNVRKLTNHTLTASSTADLATGERIEYEWSTPGAFGVFKVNGLEVTTAPSSVNTTVTYYGKIAPNTNNVETIYVTAYIKGPNGTRELGTDTAYVNVKSLLIVMEPNGGEVTPKAGTPSIRLYLRNSDGTDPMTQGNGVQYKAEWSTAGTYGDFGGTTQVTTAHNNLTYTATDEDVLSGTETITANIYFKLSSGDWIFLQKVTGTVKIINDPKIKIYYTSPRPYSFANFYASGRGCGVYVPEEEYAIKYEVAVTNIISQQYPTYNDSWNANDPNHLRGYMGYAIEDDAAAEAAAVAGKYYVTGVYGSFSWSSCPGGCANVNNPPNCTGTARVKVTLSQ